MPIAGLMRRRLRFGIVVFMMFIVYICTIDKDAEDVTIIKLRTIFKQPVNFTQHEIVVLENDFEDQEHPLLLERLRSHWIHTPSPGPLTLSNMTKIHYSQHGQSEKVDKLLQAKNNGFFIECGAYDGEEMSNSVFFERSRNWTGLLVEPQPYLFNRLINKHRNAYSINACLNTRNKTGKYSFFSGTGRGGLVHEMKRKNVHFPKTTVQCFTLHSILKVLGIRQIDFFSLDVEGAELGVLKTIPFLYLDIDLFLIEYLINDKRKDLTESRYMDIHLFLTGKGYELIDRSFVDLLYRKKKNPPPQ